MQMKLKDFLDQATRKLESAGIGTARLDSLVLLEDELGKERSWLLSRPEIALQDRTLQSVNAKL